MTSKFKRSFEENNEEHLPNFKKPRKNSFVNEFRMSQICNDQLHHELMSCFENNHINLSKQSPTFTSSKKQQMSQSTQTVSPKIKVTQVEKPVITQTHEKHTSPQIQDVSQISQISLIKIINNLIDQTNLYKTNLKDLNNAVLDLFSRVQLLEHEFVRIEDNLNVLNSNSKFTKSLICMVALIEFIEQKATYFVYNCDEHDLPYFRKQLMQNSDYNINKYFDNDQLLRFNKFCQKHIDRYVGDWQSFIQICDWFKCNQRQFSHSAIFSKNYQSSLKASERLKNIVDVFQTRKDVGQNNMSRDFLQVNGQKIIDIAYQNW